MGRSQVRHKLTIEPWSVSLNLFFSFAACGPSRRRHADEHALKNGQDDDAKP